MSTKCIFSSKIFLHVVLVFVLTLRPISRFLSRDMCGKKRMVSHIPHIVDAGDAQGDARGV